MKQLEEIMSGALAFFGVTGFILLISAYLNWNERPVLSHALLDYSTIFLGIHMLGLCGLWLFTRDNSYLLEIALIVLLWAISVGMGTSSLVTLRKRVLKTERNIRVLRIVEP
jgi:hypothetical protein